MPVYLRITADGNAKEWCTSRKCDPKIWNQAAGIALGKKEEIKELNSHLEILKMKVYEIRRSLIESNKPVSAEVLKNVLTGKNEKPRMLLEIYQKHNDQMAALVGSEYAHARCSVTKLHWITLVLFCFGSISYRILI